MKALQNAKIMNKRTDLPGQPSKAAALDLSPAPAARAPVRRVLRHGSMELMLLVRNGEQLLLALIIPVLFLIAIKITADDFAHSSLPASVLALAIWSSAFTSTAIATGFDRRYGVLERLAATPLGKPGLVIGKVVAVVSMIIGQLVVLAAIGLALGWRPHYTMLGIADSVLATLLAITAFVGLAMLLAGRLRAEATLALANVIYVILLAGGGLVIPVSRYPGVMQDVVQLLPTGALGETLRTAATGDLIWWTLLVSAVWAAIFTAAAGRTFRWMS